MDIKRVLVRGKRDVILEQVEIPDHPWFIAGQFHPEFTSTPRDGHPLFTGFVAAAGKYQKENH